MSCRVLAVLLVGALAVPVWGQEPSSSADPETAASAQTPEPPQEPTSASTPEAEDAAVPPDQGAGASSAGSAPGSGTSEEAGSVPRGPQPVAPPPAVEPACDPEKGDVCLTAEQQGREKGHIWGRGFADLRIGEMRVQTDALDIYDVETPQGTTQRLVAEGDVVLLRREERLMGDKLTMDLNTGKGTIENAVGYLDPGIYFTAKTLERLDPRTFEVHGARFSSCCQPHPRWAFRASSAKLRTGDKILAKNVLFTVGVPVWPKTLPTPIYFPYFAYPLAKGGRATGLLIPSFSVDLKRGVDVRAGFFWAMGRSADQTFSYEQRAKLPPRVTHELRYLREGLSQGDFRTTLFPPRKASTDQTEGLPPPNLDWDYDLQWNAIQELPGSFIGKVRVNRTSPQNYLTALTTVYNRYEDSTLTFQGLLGRQSLLLMANERATIYDQGTKALRRYLPQFRLSMVPQRLGKSGVVLGYSLQLDRLQSAFPATAADRRTDTWSRFDVFPSISRPVSVTFLTLNPSVNVRYTHYSATYPWDEEAQQQIIDNGPTGGPLSRRYLEASLEMEGPSFSRVFTNPTTIYSDKFKHVISPQVTWLVRSASAGTEGIPTFDGVDNQYSTHEITYGFVNRFYSRRHERGRRPTPYEFLSWNIYQVYYLDVPQSVNDPNFTSDLRGPGGTIVDRSPIRSRIRFQPVPEWNLDWLTEYDTNFKQTRRTDLRSHLGGSLGGIDVQWTKSMRVPNKGTELKLSDHTVSGRANLRLFDRAIELGATSTYNFPTKLYLDRSLYVRFKVQCFGLMVQWLQRYINRQQVPSIAFSIDLENLGSIGMDPDRRPGQARY
jgi:hypothetical protein